MRASTLRGIWKCAALLVLASACEPAAGAAARAHPAAPAVTISRDTAHEPLWSYRLTKGWLKSVAPTADSAAHAREPEVTAECRGRAAVRPCPGGRCWSWALRDVKCTGRGNPNDADWLHDGTSSSYVCRGDTAGDWKTGEIPGKGFCVPEGTFDKRGELIRIKLQCDWQCRFPEYGCYGGAVYELTRDTLPTSAPTQDGSR